MATEWKQTHTIVAESQIAVYSIPVMLLDGICYTEREWTDERGADWSYDERDGLCYYGSDQTYQTTTNTIREVQR